MVLNALGEGATCNDDDYFMGVSTACNSSALLDELLCCCEIALFRLFFTTDGAFGGQIPFYVQ